MIRTVLAIAVLLTTAAASAQPRVDDPEYTRANLRLARAIPPYPRARLLASDDIAGEIGSPESPTRYQARLTIFAIPQRATSRVVTQFYVRRLRHWRHPSRPCFVSRSRLVVVVVNPRRHRLGVFADTRSGRRCHDLAGLFADVVDNYP